MLVWLATSNNYIASSHNNEEGLCKKSLEEKKISVGNKSTVSDKH